MRTPPTPITPSNRLQSPLPSPTFSTTPALLNFTSDAHSTKGDDHGLVCRRLREILSPNDADRLIGKQPRIVTIGAESSGKSSMLKAITGIPLHIDPGTATRGPTSVLSTHTPAEPYRIQVDIEAKVRRGEGIRRFPFYSGGEIGHNELRHLLQLAGDEARRYDESGTVRPYKNVKGLSSNEWVTCPEFTTNEVVLSISGPVQDNLQLVDLPGIGGEGTASFIKNLITHYVSQKENIIVIVMGAGGDNPTMTDAVRLAIEHDLKGERSMVVLTRADRIEVVDESSWVGMVTGQITPFGAWKPKLGIWPLRLQGPAEIEQSMSDMTFKLVEANFWKSAIWEQKRVEAGVKAFGIDATRERLMEALTERLGIWRAAITPIIQEHQKAITSALAALPPRVDNPVASIHEDIIEEIKAKVESALTGHGETNDKLVESQTNLVDDVLAVALIFKPITKQHYRSSASIDSVETIPHREVFLDELFTVRESSFRNKRSGQYNEEGLLACLVEEIGQRRRKVVEAYVDSTWETVRAAVQGGIEDTCGEKLELAKQALQAATSLLKQQQEMTLRIVTSVFCDLESADPSKVGLRIPNDQPYQSARDALLVEHRRFYKLSNPTTTTTTTPSKTSPSVNSTERATTPLSPQSSPTSHTSSTPVSTSPTQSQAPIQAESTSTSISPPICPIPYDQAYRVIRLMAHIDTHLKISGQALARNVGRKVQVDLLAFVKALPAVLREALGLHQVEIGALKRCQDWHEPAAVRAKRTKLEKEVALVEEVRSLLEPAQSE